MAERLMATATTAGSATTTDVVLDVSRVSVPRPMNRAEACQRQSDNAADAALAWGVRGRTYTAEALAWLADQFALLAILFAVIDAADTTLLMMTGPEMGGQP